MQKGNVPLKYTKNQVLKNETTKYKCFKTVLKYSTSVNVCGFFVDQDREKEKVKSRQRETLTSKSAENCTNKLQSSFQLKYLKITGIEHLRFLCPFKFNINEDQN